MSATAWRPVNSTLSSAGPQPTFTLIHEKRMSRLQQKSWTFWNYTLLVALPLCIAWLWQTTRLTLSWRGMPCLDSLEKTAKEIKQRDYWIGWLMRYKSSLTSFTCTVTAQSGNLLKKKKKKNSNSRLCSIHEDRISQAWRKAGPGS